MLLVFLDTETTGLNPEKHRIIDIAFKVVDAKTGTVVCSYSSLISHSQEIWMQADPMSLQVNGFTYEEILQGKEEEVVAEEIIELLQHAHLSQKSGAFVCQNPSFDRLFFSQLISVEKQDSLKWPYHWMDLASMYWAYRFYKDQKSAYELKEEGLSKDNIAAYFHLPPEEKPHRAENGVNHLILCYQSIFPKREDA